MMWTAVVVLLLCGLGVQAGICNMPMDPGNGGESEVRWYYDPELMDCQDFIYSGSGGNPNRFLSRDDCIAVCY
ncbi:COL7A1 [Cordylochernes scorpioides]|uniref:COL7A1 n=1 Tax=Cordylochernes scorpioides TaxID=51811 RepID=A0ABY6L0I0_9ARAC|nr:COL7A1 [Cordylochernes scorpioides]